MRGNLVLSRKIGEKVMIEDKSNHCQTMVTVVGFDRGQVRLSFDAPKTVSVDREEIYKIKNIGAV